MKGRVCVAHWPYANKLPAIAAPLPFSLACFRQLGMWGGGVEEEAHNFAIHGCLVIYYRRLTQLLQKCSIEDEDSTEMHTFWNYGGFSWII